MHAGFILLSLLMDSGQVEALGRALTAEKDKTAFEAGLKEQAEKKLSEVQPEVANLQAQVATALRLLGP